MNKYTLLVTCEHAGNAIPPAYAYLFEGAEQELQSHAGWDPGAWYITQHIGNVFGIKPFGVHTTRLLIEPNRSLSHPQLFSTYSKPLPEDQKIELIKTIYLGHRDKVEAAIHTHKKPVLHLSIHSFTPIWNNQLRKVDLGLLFDPDRKQELNFSLAWKEAIETLSDVTCKFNEPYKGIDDGFTTYLRTRFHDDDYLGIELEVNQKFINNLDPIKGLITQSLQNIIIE